MAGLFCISVSGQIKKVVPKGTTAKGMARSTTVNDKQATKIANEVQRQTGGTATYNSIATKLNNALNNNK